MGVDPKSEKQIQFDISDPKYMEAYFKYLHHPYEEEGVDFWWIDWQQGKKSKIKGLDPLWALNHYHYLDNCRDSKRGMILRVMPSRAVTAILWAFPETQKFLGLF